MDSFAIYVGAAMVAGSVVVMILLLTAPGPADDVRSNLSRGSDSRRLALQATARRRLLDPLFDVIARLSRGFTGEGAAAAVRRKLELAGLQDSGWTVERLLVVRALSLAIGAMVAIVALTGGVTQNSVLVAVSSLAVGYLLPAAWLNRNADQRQRSIERQLPDIIDQITVSVEAGLGFDAALARSADGRTGPLADELRRVLQDIQIGATRDEALDRLVERTEVADLRQFVVSIRQATRHGLPIARVLHVQSLELREKRRARVEERAGSLPVKIVFPLVFCILPPLFVVILGPAMIDINDAF